MKLNLDMFKWFVLGFNAGAIFALACYIVAAWLLNPVK